LILESGADTKPTDIRTYKSDAIRKDNEMAVQQVTQFVTVQDMLTNGALDI